MHGRVFELGIVRQTDRRDARMQRQLRKPSSGQASIRSIYVREAFGGRELPACVDDGDAVIQALPDDRKRDGDVHGADDDQLWWRQLCFEEDAPAIELTRSSLPPSRSMPRMMARDALSSVGAAE